jgi:GA4 desaturase
MSDTTYSIVRFGIPDQSIGPEGRGLFAFPPTKEVKEETLPLHDARTSSDIVRGAGGLDVQGFAFINHMSKLAETGAWFDGNNIEEIYFPEVIDLVCHVTGAKKAAILDSAFRHRLADKQADLSFYRENGDGVDKELTKLPRDTPLGKLRLRC